MTMEKVCATCRYWLGDAATYRASCAIGAVYGTPAFDDGCPQHTMRQVVATLDGTPITLPDDPVELDAALAKFRAALRAARQARNAPGP